MSAMENASNNAGMLILTCMFHRPNLIFFFFSGDMISSLTLLFNRTRQAVITRELIEIISGASALE